jgi:hypothetical protein
VTSVDVISKLQLLDPDAIRTDRNLAKTEVARYAGDYSLEAELSAVLAATAAPICR